MVAWKKRIIAAAIICAVASVAVLSLAPSGAAPWVSLVFVLADIVIPSAVLWQISGGGLGKYVTNAAFALGLWTPLAVSAMAAFAAPFLGVLGAAVPLKWFCVAQILLLAFAGLVALSLGAGQRAIEGTQRRRDVSSAAWTAIRVDIDAIAGRAPEGVRGDILKVREAIRYADPVSDPRAALIEESLARDVVTLAEYVDGGRIDGIPELCAGMLAKVADRANRRKLLK